MQAQSEKAESINTPHSPGFMNAACFRLEKRGKYEIRREDSPAADLRHSLFHLNEAGDEQRQVDDQQKNDDQADQIRHDGL